MSKQLTPSPHERLRTKTQRRGRKSQVKGAEGHKDNEEAEGVVVFLLRPLKQIFIYFLDLEGCDLCFIAVLEVRVEFMKKAKR